jgi:DNA-directed RNA polymerase subunit RPC12/RpoP
MVKIYVYRCPKCTGEYEFLGEPENPVCPDCKVNVTLIAVLEE